MLTFNEVKERLCLMDEVSLLELLDIQSSDLVGAFLDKIEDNLETITKELND